MKNAKTTKAILGWVGILCLAMIGHSHAGAQGLFTELGAPMLDRQQERLLEYVKDSPMNHSLRFIEVDMETLKGNSFVFQPNGNESYTVVKNRRGEEYAGLTSWCGTIDDGRAYGDINMVLNGDELVGHIAMGNRIFAITPLGKGIHAFYEVDSSLTPPEECFTDREEDDDHTPAKAPKGENPDLLLDNSGAPKATGECKIRVLIGFTDSAKNRFTSISAQLLNQVNLANAAYDNAEVGFNIEIAMAYEVDYVETDTLGRDLNRWQGTDDGFMDEVHTNRTLFDGDMCALIVNDGGGKAKGTLQYANTFSVTGTDNFGVFTFHHELGHNMGCTHDLINTDEPGNPPYAGYGEPTVACFRTIMAYQAACGSLFGCSRVNVFSRAVDTYTCDMTDYPKGGPNNRNRDRLVLSKDAINNHTTVFTSVTYAGDYNWRNQEIINFVTEETVGYNSTTNNRWDMFNGSEGSFRASEEVTLGEGFWARTGATFSAYLESCEDISPGLSTLAAVDPGYDAAHEAVPSGVSERSHNTDGSKFFHELSVFPNPFKESTTVQFLFHGGDQRVSITLRDILGREAMQIASASEFSEGQHQIEINTSQLPTGIYLLTLRAGDDVMVKRIIKTN